MIKVLNFYETKEALPNGHCQVLAKIESSYGYFWDVIDYNNGEFTRYPKERILQWAKLGDPNE